MEYAQYLLEEVGLEPERLEMYESGASDAPKWVAAVQEMTERAQALGPNPLKQGASHPADVLDFNQPGVEK